MLLLQLTGSEIIARNGFSEMGRLELASPGDVIGQGPDYKKILRLSYDVIITYDNRKSNLR